MTCVYFIKPISMDGPIKIGVSCSPDGRRQTLERWSPFPLEIVATFDGGFSTEQAFHEAFAHLHIGREWFEAAPELLAVIDAVADGSFHVGMLPDRRVAAGPNWRARRPLPKWVGKQAGLTRQCRSAEMHSRHDCPVEYLGVYRDERWEDLARAEAYIASPAQHGVPRVRAA